MTINLALTVSIILFIQNPLGFDSEVYRFCTKVTFQKKKHEFEEYLNGKDWRSSNQVIKKYMEIQIRIYKRI